MKVIGLTGGVGSGKSVVAQKMQEALGAQTLISDELGHRVMEQGQPAFAQIRQRFGEEIIGTDGQIDRNALAQIIFQDSKARKDLNQVIHPAVITYIQEYIEARKTQEGLLVVESAILFESGCERLCDEVWYVYVPMDLRIKRLMESRGYSEEKCRAMIAGQMTEQEYRHRADKVLVNDDTPAALVYKIKELLTPGRSAAEAGSDTPHNNNPEIE